MTFPPEKICSRCQQSKPLDDFHKDKNGKYGRVAKCKTCIQEERGSTPMKKKPPVQPGNKWCIHCQRELSLDYFARDQRASDGRVTRCLDCESKAHGYKTRRAYLREIPQDLPPNARYCLACQQIKPIDEFGIQHKPHGDFYRRQCNSCRQIEAKKRYVDNPEYFQNYRNQPARKEKLRIYSKNYYTQNRPRLLVSFRIWKQNNKDTYRAGVQKGRDKNPEGYKRLRVVLAARRRARLRSLPSTLTSAEFQYALDYFDNCCAVCGREPDNDFVLAADHWRSVASGGGTTADNIIPLCHSRKAGSFGGCNNRKGAKDGEKWVRLAFPHLADEILEEIDLYFLTINR